MDHFVFRPPENQLGVLGTFRKSGGYLQIIREIEFEICVNGCSSIRQCILTDAFFQRFVFSGVVSHLDSHLLRQHVEFVIEELNRFDD